jgi:4-hydroxyacetophenone monooxygenase
VRDDPTLADALERANLVVLVSALAHLTGDRALLSRYPVAKFDRGWNVGSLSKHEKAGIRAHALELLGSLERGEIRPGPYDDDRLVFEIMQFCAGEPIDDAYVRMVREECVFGGADLRRPEWERRPPREKLDAFHVGIIGSGFGGLCAAIRLQQAGIPFTIYEKNDDIGGTWYENDYPDLRVDVPNHFYSYSFEPNPDWSSFFARRDELKTYIDAIADKHALREHVRLRTEVVSAQWDEGRASWNVRLRGAAGAEEEVRVRALISAVGMLNRPSVPDLPGLRDFSGIKFHSSHWDRSLALAGQRVGVIGTGASGMQIVPAIAPEVAQLKVFQRGRHWALPNPMYHREVSEQEKFLFRHVPHYGAWYRFLLMWTVGDRGAPSFMRDPVWEKSHPLSISEANEERRVMMTEHIRAELHGDEALIAKVLPDYPAMGKRILQDNGWYRTLLRANVELVNEGIARITRKGVLTEDGVERALDVLVLATGFHPNKFLWPMEIRGRSGTRLHDVWGDDPRAYLGITMPSFPNLFCLYGPNTNPLVGSVIFMLECQVTYVVKCIAAMIARDLHSLECRRDVHDEYNRRVDEAHEGLVWRHPKVHSYYNNAVGRVTTNVPWKLIDYWRMTSAPDLADFVVGGQSGSV